MCACLVWLRRMHVCVAWKIKFEVLKVISSPCLFTNIFSAWTEKIKRKKSSIRISRTERTTLLIFFKTLNQYAYHPYYYLYISYGATITGRIFWHARASSVCDHLFFLMSFKFDLGVIPLRKIRRRSFSRLKVEGV